MRPPLPFKPLAWLALLLAASLGACNAAPTATSPTTAPPTAAPPTTGEKTPIVFEYATQGNNGFDRNLVFMYPDGSDKHRLTTDSRGNHTPQFSPDGTQIAFLSAVSGATELHVMAADGSDARQLTHGLDADNDNFARFLWLPEGQSLLVETAEGWQILDAASGAMSPYPDWPSSLDFLPMAFSHDGTRLLYLAGDQLRVQDRDGANDQALTDGSMRVFAPAWTPDDRQIIFISSPDYANEPVGSFYIMDADGNNLRLLTEQEYKLPLFFAISPDGQEMAYSDGTVFAILNLDSGESTVLFKAEWPDYIGSIAWQP